MRSEGRRRKYEDLCMLFDDSSRIIFSSETVGASRLKREDTGLPRRNSALEKSDLSESGVVFLSEPRGKGEGERRVRIEARG